MRLGSCWPSCFDFRTSEALPVKIWVAYKKNVYPDHPAYIQTIPCATKEVIRFCMLIFCKNRNDRYFKYVCSIFLYILTLVQSILSHLDFNFDIFFYVKSILFRSWVIFRFMFISVIRNGTGQEWTCENLSPGVPEVLMAQS